MKWGIHAAANYVARIFVMEKAWMMEEDGKGVGVGRRWHRHGAHPSFPVTHMTFNRGAVVLDHRYGVLLLLMLWRHKARDEVR